MLYTYIQQLSTCTEGDSKYWNDRDYNGVAVPRDETRGLSVLSFIGERNKLRRGKHNFMRRCIIK